MIIVKLPNTPIPRLVSEIRFIRNMLSESFEESALLRAKVSSTQKVS